MQYLRTCVICFSSIHPGYSSQNPCNLLLIHPSRCFSCIHPSRNLCNLPYKLAFSSIQPLLSIPEPGVSLVSLHPCIHPSTLSIPVVCAHFSSIHRCFTSQVSATLHPSIDTFPLGTILALLSIPAPVSRLFSSIHADGQCTLPIRPPLFIHPCMPGPVPPSHEVQESIQPLLSIPEASFHAWSGGECHSILSASFPFPVVSAHFSSHLIHPGMPGRLPLW